MALHLVKKTNPDFSKETPFRHNACVNVWKLLPMYLHWCNIAVMLEDKRLQSIGLKGERFKLTVQRNHY